MEKRPESHDNIYSTPAIIQICNKDNFLLNTVLFKSPDSAVTVELYKISPTLIVFEYRQSFRGVVFVLHSTPDLKRWLFICLFTFIFCIITVMTVYFCITIVFFYDI